MLHMVISAAAAPRAQLCRFCAAPAAARGAERLRFRAQTFWIRSVPLYHQAMYHFDEPARWQDGQ
jgi:hypothetical protein